jgi:hypothetical protein
LKALLKATFQKKGFEEDIETFRFRPELSFSFHKILLEEMVFPQPFLGLFSKRNARNPDMSFVRKTERRCILSD